MAAALARQALNPTERELGWPDLDALGLPEPIVIIDLAGAHGKTGSTKQRFTKLNVSKALCLPLLLAECLVAKAQRSEL